MLAGRQDSVARLTQSVFKLTAPDSITFSKEAHMLVSSSLTDPVSSESTDPSGEDSSHLSSSQAGLLKDAIAAYSKEL